MCGPGGPAGGDSPGTGGNIGNEGGGSGGYSGGYDPGKTSPGDKGSTATTSGQSSGSGGIGGGGPTPSQIQAARAKAQAKAVAKAAKAAELNAEQAEQAALNEAAAQSDTSQQAAEQAEQAALNTIVAEAQQEPTALAKAVSIISKAAQFAASLVIGKKATEIITDALTATKMNSESVAAAITGIISGNGMDVANGISNADFGGGPGDMGGPGNYPDNGSAGGGQTTSGGGSTGGTVSNNDPLSYDFWNNFVDEWMGKNSKSAKDMYAEDDAFKKSQVEPAIGKYQAVLADLTNQAKTGTGNYTPITFGMGDFRSSFVPKSGLAVADDLRGYGKDELGASLALTDVMQPNKGGIDYLGALKAIAQWEYEMKQQRDLAEKGLSVQKDVGTFQPEDKGTWLDAIKDIVQIGDTAGDAWEKIFG